MQLKVFFKYRKLYMGVAALLLVVYHGRDLLPAGRFRELLSFFYGTVDFFLFCSGIGCFFSYTSDRDPAAFLKRRVRRLYPIYLAFMAYWLYGFLAADGIALPDILGNLLCVQWLTGREPVFNWYMSALLVTYLLTPALAALAEWADSRLKALLALLALLVVSVAFWDATQFVIITTRLPLFFAGMLFAAESRRRERLARWELLLLILLMLPGALLLRRSIASNSEALLWNRGMYWYPFLLIIPGACVLLALAAQLLERRAPGRWLVTGLDFVGGYTFEIFVTHCYALYGSFQRYLLFAALYAAALHLASRLLRRAAALPARLLGRRETVS